MTKGDMIKCATKDDAVEAMRGLAKLGICTEFVYSGDEIWLEVTEEGSSWEVKNSSKTK